MAFDKIQVKAIDVDSAPTKGSVNNNDYVFIRDVVTGEMQKVLVSDLLAGSAGAVRLQGEADFTAGGTTPTSVVITGDSNNATITAGQAPTGTSPNGMAYTVKAPVGGVETQISSATERVFPDDQLVWTGSKWSILSLGSQVSSVNGRTGDVTGLAERSDLGNYYTKAASDGRFLNLAGGELVGPLRVDEIQVKPRWAGNVSMLKLGTYVATPGFGDKTELRACGVSDRNRNGGLDVFTDRVRSNVPFYEGTSRVYSQAHKPTSADVGLPNVPNYTFTDSVSDSSSQKFAAASAVKAAYEHASSAIARADSMQTSLSWHGGTGNNANAYEAYNHVGFSYGSKGNTPYPGTMMHFASKTGYGTQFNTHYQTGKGLAFRTYNGDHQTWNPWYTVYHTGNKPTAADVGALPANTPLFSGNYGDLQGVPTYFKSNWGSIDGKPSTYPSAPHDHNNLYYTKAEVEAKDYLTEAEGNANYSAIGHNHNATYYTKSQSDSKYMKIGHTPTWNDVQSKPATATRWPNWGEVSGKPITYAPSAHNHDTQYYTKSQTDWRFVNAEGDSMTGPLRVDSIQCTPNWGGNIDMVKLGIYEAGLGDKTEIRACGVSTANRTGGIDVYTLRTRSNANLYEREHRVYSDGNKPSPATLGCEPTLDGTRKRKITISNAAPTGGNSGDVWFRYV